MRSDKGKSHNYPKTRKLKGTTQRSDTGKKHNYPKERKNKSTGRKEYVPNYMRYRKVTDTLYKDIQETWKYNKNAKVSVYGREANKKLKRGFNLLKEAEKFAETYNKRVSNKVIERYKEWFTFNTYPDVTSRRPTQYANFQMMILEELKNNGVNIYDPTELNKVLHGMSVDEISELWNHLDELDEGDTVVRSAYYVFKDDPIDFLNKLAYYKKKLTLSKKKQDEALIALGINPA